MTLTPSSVVFVGVGISIWGALFVWMALAGSDMSCAGCSLPLWPFVVFSVGLAVVVVGSALWLRSRGEADAAEVPPFER